MFNKKSNAPATENNLALAINFNNVVFIVVHCKDKQYVTRFFFGKRLKGKNTEITIGIKEENQIREKNEVILIYNMLNGDRYKQCGFVIENKSPLITVELDDLVEQLDEKRESIKVSSKLTGELSVMGQKVIVDIRNISVGGVFIEAEYDLPIRSINLLNISEICLCARIILLRQQKNRNGVIEGYGCQFENLSDKNQEKIIQHINSVLIKERQTLLTRDVYNYFSADLNMKK